MDNLSKLYAVAIVFSMSIIACGTSEAEPQAQSTDIAAFVFATETALAPTVTLTFTPTATPTPTSTPTSTPPATATEIPTTTSTPSPDVAIKMDRLTVREGPGTAYTSIGQLSKKDELYVLGQFENCNWLKVGNPQQVIGWISGSRQNVDLKTTCDLIPPGTFRPLTGIIKPNTHGGGSGELSVENGTSTDGVVIMTLDDTPIMAAYIRSGASFRMRGIRDGIYNLYFSTGSEWDGKKFTVDPTRQRFDDTFIFTTSATTYTTWRVTLQPVAGGTASTAPVNESEFPDIGK